LDMPAGSLITQVAAALTSAGFKVSVLPDRRDMLLVDSPTSDALLDDLKSHVVFVTAGRDPDYRFGHCVVDLSTGKAARNGIALALTARELQLLRYLVLHQNRAVSRQELLHQVWGYASTQTRTVDVHLATLRQKLEDCPARPKHFLTVRRHGYMFRD
jgi:hypothetical protein